jgi:hypothetical protein
MLTRYAGVILAVALMTAAPAAAQSSARPPAAVELLAGYAGFVDDAPIDHSVFGGAARVYLTPRLAVGPEVLYMIGPGDDRDLFFTGNLTFDLLHPRAGRPPRVSPFVVAGGGFFRHSDRFGPLTFSSNEGAFTAGGGSRFWLGDRFYALLDFRIGWELHYRLNGGVGIALAR